jgi:hypothetical protein
MFQRREIGGRDLQLAGEPGKCDAARRSQAAQPGAERRHLTRRSSSRTEPVLVCEGCVAARMSARRCGRLIQCGNSRRNTPPSPAPRPVTTSTQRRRSCRALWMKTEKARNALCAVRPCRSSVRCGRIRPPRNFSQDEVSRPAAGPPTVIALTAGFRAITGGRATASAGRATAGGGAGTAAGTGGDTAGARPRKGRVPIERVNTAHSSRSCSESGRCRTGASRRPCAE